MAVGNVQAEVQKSTPDIGKLNNMTGRIVHVTRHLTKTGAAQLVVPPTKGMSVDSILSLQSSLPERVGAGTYRFEVVEEGGVEKDTWTVKLGTEPAEQGAHVASLISSEPPFSRVSLPASSDGPAVRDLGHGYKYDAELGVLTTPSKQIVNWRPGEPLPGSLGSFTLPALNTPAATPLPVMPSVDPQVEHLKEQLRLMQERQVQEAHRTELNAIQTALAKSIEDSNRKFEMLLTKMSEKKGPDETVLALQKQLEETQRRAEEDKREAARREELRAMQERTDSMIRELKSTNKGPDPMLTLVTQLLTTMQSSGNEAIRAMAESSRANLEAAKASAELVSERLGSSSLTPERLMQLVHSISETTKGANGEINRGLVEMFGSLFSMSKEMLQIQMQGQQGDPAWMPLAQQGIETIGRVAAMVAANNAKKAQTQTIPVQARVVRPPVAAAAPAPVLNGAQHAAAPVPPAPPPAPPTAAELRDQAAAKVFSGVQTPANVVTPDSVQAPPKKKRGRKPRAEATQQAPAPANGAVDLRHETAETVRGVTNMLPDPEFFGPAMEQIIQLREYAKSVPPQEVAGAILSAREYFASFGEVPPAIELLYAGHFDVLVDRCLPEADAVYRAGVAAEMRSRVVTESIAAEGEGEDEEAEDGADE